MTLDEAREIASAGDGRVTYDPPGEPRQHGFITRVNAKYVFVRYEGDLSSTATYPEDLTASWA